ncbi:hypothetical protein Bca4012_026379 [Brassica carinata]
MRKPMLFKLKDKSVLLLHLQPPGLKRINPTASEFRKDICQTSGLQEELEDILNGSAKGYECNLDLGPHPVGIESGPPPEDRVRCRMNSIQPLGLRQQNKSSPPVHQKEFLITSRFSRTNILWSSEQGDTSLNPTSSQG